MALPWSATCCFTAMPPMSALIACGYWFSDRSWCAGLELPAIYPILRILRHSRGRRSPFGLLGLSHGGGGGQWRDIRSDGRGDANPLWQILWRQYLGAHFLKADFGVFGRMGHCKHHQRRSSPRSYGRPHSHRLGSPSGRLFRRTAYDWSIRSRARTGPMNPDISDSSPAGPEVVANASDPSSAGGQTPPPPPPFPRPPFPWARLALRHRFQFCRLGRVLGNCRSFRAAPLHHHCDYGPRERRAAADEP